MSEQRAIVPYGGAELLPPDSSTPIVRIGGPPDPPPPRVHETRTPRRDPKLETDVFVPLAQAVITATALGLAAGLLALGLGWSWRVPVVLWALAVIFGWFWRLRVVDSLLWTIESWVDQDLTGDNLVGRPVVSYTLANPATARQTIAQETRQAEQSAERAALLAFVDACYVKGCGEHAHGVRASGPDRADYVTRRDALMGLGVAAWKFPGNPKGGWKMTCSRQRARSIIEKHVL